MPNRFGDETPQPVAGSNRFGDAAPAPNAPSGQAPALIPGVDLGPSPTMAKVGNTIFQDLANAPTHIMNFLSGHPVDQAIEGLQNLTAARQQHMARAVDAFKKGDYQTAATQGFFGSVPFLGPALGAAADEYQGGHKPEAVAHAVETLAPFLGDPVMAGLESQAAARLGQAATRAADVTAAGVSGGLTGAVRGAIQPTRYGRFNLPIPQSVAGAAAGGYAARALGLPHEAGAIIGAGIPVVQGAIKGARQAIAAKMVGPELLDTFAALKYGKDFKGLDVPQQAEVLGAAAKAGGKEEKLPDTVTQELTRPTEPAPAPQAVPGPQPAPVAPIAPQAAPQAPAATVPPEAPPQANQASVPAKAEPFKAAAREARSANAETLSQAFQDAGITSDDLRKLRVFRWPEAAKNVGVDFPVTHEARLKLMRDTIARLAQKEAKP